MSTDQSQWSRDQAAEALRREALHREALHRAASSAHVTGLDATMSFQNPLQQATAQQRAQAGEQAFHEQALYDSEAARRGRDAPAVAPQELELPDPLLVLGTAAPVGNEDATSPAFDGPMTSPPAPPSQAAEPPQAAGAPLPFRLPELPQAFQQPTPRPSFPAAPSKVLAEQRAKGHSGHITYADQGFSSHGGTPGADFNPQEQDPAAGSYAQAFPPSPETPEPRFQALHDELLQGELPQGESLRGEAGPSPRRAVHLQQATPSPVTGFAGLEEPDLTERGGQASEAGPGSISGSAPGSGLGPGFGVAASRRAAAGREGAFWQFQPGAQDCEELQDHRTSWALIGVAILVLLALLGLAVWSQVRGTPTFEEPLVIAAPTGPERVVPADPGGFVVPNQDLGVLNQGVLNQGVSATGPNPALSSPGTQVAIPTPSFDDFEIIEDLPDTRRVIDPALAQLVDAAGFENLPAAGARRAEVEIPVPIPAGAEAATGTAVGDTTGDATGAATVAPTTALPAFAPRPRPADIPPRLPRATQLSGSGRTPASQPDAGDGLLVTTAPRGLYVQEGAYATLESAQAAFATLQQRGGERLADIAPQFHRVEVDRQTIYRLYLTGFETLSEAAIIGSTFGRDESNWFIRNG